MYAFNTFISLKMLVFNAITGCQQEETKQEKTANKGSHWEFPDRSECYKENWYKQHC